MFGKSAKTQSDIEFFTIYDSKTQSYDVPTFAPNKDVLIREIMNMFKDPNQSKNKFLINAEDYSVFRIASYDKKTGKVEAQNPEHIVNLHELRALTEPAGQYVHLE